MKAELEKLTIRHEVLSAGVDRLTLQVASLAEDLGELRDEMNSRFEALTGQMNSRFTALETTQTAILSAVMKLLPR